MDRRKFFKNGSLFTIGTAVLNPFELSASTFDDGIIGKNKTAKNIIFLVSDGMSTGTLNMADLFMNRKYGKSSNWLQLYKDNKVKRALMDTASASSIVTDSAAGSSSWGGGVRVNNGSLNVGPDGKPNMPILQKFKKAGKMAGCVTTVAITHATPAGFCITSAKRSAQDDIAEMYLDLEFDVMMGGGNNYFDAKVRKDKKDVYAGFYAKGYQIVRNKQELLAAKNDKPILGIFDEDAVPYSIDRINSPELSAKIPTLAEMAQKAIDRMKDHKKGFVLQVESGKVDWAAHANDIAGLIHEQLAFDEAVKVAMDFAEKDGNTLVIITTDHGNANPGVIYGKNASDNFDSIQKYTNTNEVILNSFNSTTTASQIREKFEATNGKAVSDDEAKEILSYYNGLHKQEDGLYNYKKLPFKALADIQQKHNAVGWISMDHSADYVELAMYGPGSELLKPFVKNTDLHYLMLQVAEVENKF
ncbi:alkaline phosphatase [Flavobacterium macacae]|uniref:Alkaline phosphatase n=1 Tax=Flavobacterium macacae TaxID=2488993 RepID=A0A3P3WCV1_9FLAO|nr:alkaline phosphatase [Flavobacterium macacae]RRJ92992.1 alkaline phosphatase [Flavobacterium macacae]